MLQLVLLFPAAQARPPPVPGPPTQVFFFLDAEQTSRYPGQSAGWGVPLAGTHGLVYDASWCGWWSSPRDTFALGLRDFGPGTMSTFDPVYEQYCQAAFDEDLKEIQVRVACSNYEPLTHLFTINPHEEQVPQVAEHWFTGACLAGAQSPHWWEEDSNARVSVRFMYEVQ